MRLITTYGKQMALIAISVFIPFVVLAKLENTFIPYRLNEIGAVDKVTLYDLKILFAYNMPLFYVIAFIVQTLAIIPWWNKMKRLETHLAMVCSEILSIAVVSSFAFSLIIAKLSNSFSNIVSSASILMLVQLLYWVLIYITLYSMTRMRKINFAVI